MQYASSHSSSFLFLNTKETSLPWIMFGVLAIHALALWLALNSPTASFSKDHRQRVVVKTVQLRPHLQPIAFAEPPAKEQMPFPAPTAQPEAKIETQETPVALPINTETSTPKSEPKVAEPVEIIPEKPVIKEEPEKTEAIAPKKVQEAKTENKKQAKTAAPLKPIPQIKKKTTSQSTQAPVKKSSAESSKPKPKVEKKKGPTPEEIAAQEAEKAKQRELQAAAEAAQLREQELIAKAKENLAKIGESRHKIGANKISNLEDTAIPRQIEHLQIDALPIGTGIPTELSAREASYRDEIAYRLKLGLRLPDYGEVKIKLTLEKSGKVASVQIVNSESAKNKQYIERTLPTFIFPSFGDYFANAAQYSFMITLNNDY